MFQQYSAKPLFFDATLYKDRPQTVPVQGGAARLGGIYGGLWEPGHVLNHPEKLPTWDRIEEQIKINNGRLLMIDIEHLTTNSTNINITQENARYLGDIIDMFHAVDPSVRVGYYSILPVFRYWKRDSVWKTISSYLRFSRGADGKFIAEGLGDKVDVVFPGLYAFYDDIPGWRSYAIDMIKEARRYQKQVYPFVWDHFHDGSRYVGDKFMQTMYETCNEYADGVVHWGGWQKPWSEAESTWLPIAQKIYGDTRRGPIKF